MNGGWAVNKAEITPLNNGPYFIQGEFVIKDMEGREFDLSGRTQISLCRCGHSSNKPFCDGTHKKVNFQSFIEARTLPPPIKK